MSKSPDDIIELTDIIEHGPNASKQEGAEGGVDLSFERELEYLFAESPEAKPSTQDSGIPGMDELELPGGEAKADGDGDIDLDGLDALLADAEKNQPGGGLDLPELPGDFLNDPDVLAAVGHHASSEAAPDAASSQAVEALNARLDAIEDKLSSIGDTLAANFKSMLDEAVAGIKADMPAPAEAADPSAQIAELRESLEARMDALQAELPKAVDEEALAERIKDEVLAAMPQSEAAPALDETALAERIKDEVLAAMPAASGEAGPQAGTDDLLAQVEAKLDDRLEAFKQELPAAGEASGVEETAARLQGAIDSVQARLDAVPADMSSMVDEIAASLGARMDAFEAGSGPQAAAQDLSGYVSKDELDALRQDILAEMKKAVPAAAAQIIREEIQALLKDAD